MTREASSWPPKHAQAVSKSRVTPLSAFTSSASTEGHQRSFVRLGGQLRCQRCLLVSIRHQTLSRLASSPKRCEWNDHFVSTAKPIHEESRLTIFRRNLKPNRITIMCAVVAPSGTYILQMATMSCWPFRLPSAYACRLSL
ncbi:hypothetical protein PV05_05389 [Exophiala xenobiotica]|uniref:Uncharacterized protein n=1 Tax=Exophiala xenobiotica TaxID=348802 RepID=A0A0D2F9Q3_9EURO|nr:uncharacterized protein PV05_05389 [Exophiala xenobiotica]KIW56754.1 hypothetical protein PV05_05389 [Exophiala xenobiotica]